MVKVYHRIIKKLFKCYKLAADQAHASAQINLGNSYYKGEGVSKDYKEAVKWYKLAADQGDANGQFYLGDCYEIGRGVSQDYEEANKWKQLAKDNGYVANKTHSFVSK
jgi:TPR repeat protein